jgi:hypothetical protein
LMTPNLPTRLTTAYPDGHTVIRILNPGQTLDPSSQK